MSLCLSVRLLGTRGLFHLDVALRPRIAPGSLGHRKGLRVKVRSFAFLILVLTLLPGGAAGHVHQDPSVPEAIRVVAAHVCTDEHEKARGLSAGYVDTPHGWLPFQYGKSVVSLWDGTPFVVDVSSTLHNADKLLAMVAEEANRIHAVLGYEIFVAGDVLPLTDATDSQLADLETSIQLTPPDQHIDVLCCYGNKPEVMGVANPHVRVIVLRNDAFGSTYAIIHELYHLLGFAHPGEARGVVMSEVLMRGPRNTGEGLPLPTSSTPSDLAKLACIYD